MTSEVSMVSARIRQSSGYLARRIHEQMCRERKSPACELGLPAAEKKSMQRGIIKNKAVGAVCRQRPCQPRKLKSACAFR
jgi:hypothetical protein